MVRPVHGTTKPIHWSSQIHLQYQPTIFPLCQGHLSADVNGKPKLLLLLMPFLQQIAFLPVSFSHMSMLFFQQLFCQEPRCGCEETPGVLFWSLYHSYYTRWGAAEAAMMARICRLQRHTSRSCVISYS